MHTIMIMYNISHKKYEKNGLLLNLLSKTKIHYLTFHPDSTDHMVISNLPSRYI